MGTDSSTPLNVDSELAERLRWLSGAETAERIRSGKLTARQAVAAALWRCRQAEPTLNAFARLVPERAMAEADAVQQRIDAGEELPLGGVPIAIKDDVPEAGAMVTWGSYARTMPQTATAVTIERVRAAGAVVIGATRTPELCLAPYTESLRGGLTRNPRDSQRTPGGSSGGSAAAVAAGVVPIALGGDGGGSLRGPGAWCGLPALMPTPGSVSDAPDGRKWFGMAVQGALARTIADTALIYDVLLDRPLDLRGALKAAPPTGVVVGSTYSRAGDKPFPHSGRIAQSWRQAAARGGQWLAAGGQRVVDTKIDFGRADAKFALRYALAAAEEVAKTDQPEKIEPTTRTILRISALLRRSRRARQWALDVAAERAQVERSLAGIDVVLTPTMPCPPPPVAERDSLPTIAAVLMAARRVSFLNAWNLIGWPGLTVPAGVDQDGLPTAFLLTARPGQERLLLALGSSIESTYPWKLKQL